MLVRCLEAGLAFIAWAPLAKASSQAPRARSPRPRGAWRDPGQIALAWALRQGALAIPGTGSARHLEENVGALDVELTDEEAGALERDFLLGYRAQRLARKARVRAGRIKAGVRRVSR